MPHGDTSPEPYAPLLALCADLDRLRIGFWVSPDNKLYVGPKARVEAHPTVVEAVRTYNQVFRAVLAVARKEDAR